jgi:hypothetical protein
MGALLTRDKPMAPRGYVTTTSAVARYSDLWALL